MLNFRSLRGSKITECDHIKSCKAFFKKLSSPVALFIMLNEVVLNRLHEVLWHKRKPHLRINLLNWWCNIRLKCALAEVVIYIHICGYVTLNYDHCITISSPFFNVHVWNYVVIWIWITLLGIIIISNKSYFLQRFMRHEKYSQLITIRGLRFFDINRYRVVLAYSKNVISQHFSVVLFIAPKCGHSE